MTRLHVAARLKVLASFMALRAISALAETGSLSRASVSTPPDLHVQNHQALKQGQMNHTAQFASKGAAESSLKAQQKGRGRGSKGQALKRHVQDTLAAGPLAEVIARNGSVDAFYSVDLGMRVSDLMSQNIFTHKIGRSTSIDTSLFSSVPLNEWYVLLTTCLIVLLFDVFVLQAYESTRSLNFKILGLWVTVAAGYNAYYCARYGAAEGMDWLTGYLLEWLLSTDNLFVFHLIFRVYSTPAPLIHKALFLGITGAIVFKLLFFLTLGSLMHMMDWIRFVFGAILIYSGIMAVYEVDYEEDVSQLFSVKMARKMLGSRLIEDYDVVEHRLFVSIEGKIHATMLVLVILVLEISDIVFAVDSVSAKVAQIQIQYTAYSSSVLAVFGLRAMFFVLRDASDCFKGLKLGLCIILNFIGMELMLSQWLHLASSTVCCVIVAVLLTCILGTSVARTHGGERALPTSVDKVFI
mmetsp:Transcript_50269/g.109170  ORF Transcript_50269/g.109170 Transcript_50269/m.109170 type:complete len:467 (-) Transcript_50269:196-1596(-)